MRHLLLLGAFAPLFLTIMLADRHQQSDEGSYVEFAQNLAHGYYTPRSAPDLWFGPGLPLLLAPFALVHAPLEAMRLLGPLLLFLTLILFYELLRLYVAPGVALAGAAALGLYFPFYLLLPSLHSEILALFLVVLFMFALTRDLRERRARYLLLGGAALAFLALSRIVFGWIVLAGLAVWLGVWLVRRDARSRRLAVVHALAIVLCTPWLAYTYSISHNVFYWGSSGGQSLYWMATPYPGQLGDWRSGSEVVTRPGLTPNRAEFAKLRGLNQIESDDVLRHDAIHLIKNHPTAYARHLAENLSRIWFNTPYSFTPQKLSTLFYILPNALLLAGLLGVAPLLWLRRRNLPSEVGAFLVLLVLGVGVQTLLAAYGRMLAPLVPIILWLVVFVLARHVRLAPSTAPSRNHRSDWGGVAG
jgi:4-amino-4-deoxy-L-arabinose transferase-like glycosyltransferase